MPNNNDYWRRRAEITEAMKNKNAGNYTAAVERQFNLAQKTIDEQIEQWYGRFAKNNQITLAEARQWLTGKDLAEFKWDVNEYIKYGKDAQMNPAFIKQLENASARFHVSKLEALKLKTQNTVEQLYGRTTQQSKNLFGNIFADNYYHTAFQLQQGIGIGWDITALNSKQIETVLSKPWTLDGKTFSDRLWTQKQNLLSEVHTQLTQNMLLGKPPSDAISAIAKKFNTSKTNAGRLVMTESAYFSNEAQKKAYADLDVEEVEVVGTLDGETCSVCGSLDGTHFPIAQYEVGVTAPPFHPWCRCCTAPYFEDLSGERFARDEENGKSYYVPADMPYPEWKEKFVEGGDKSGLTAVERDGVVEWTRTKVTGSLLDEEKSVTIKMGNLKQSFGEDHTNKMTAILNKAPENVKSVWNKYADDLSVVTTQSKSGNYCTRQGVSINLDEVSRETMYIGESAKKPYYTVYHEFGHNIDNLASRQRGEYSSIADTFRSAVHANSDEVGYTLTEMLELEGKQRVNNIWTRLKKEAKAAGGKATDVKKFEAYQEVTSELLSKSVLSTSDVSDMWDGITKEVIKPHFGHGKSYWKDHTVGTEAFAEMFSATIMNPESVEQIKFYFPKSYEIFEEILDEIGKVKQ